MRRFATLVVAAVLLAGCGTEEDPKPEPKAAASASSTSETSAPTASVKDFTSLVAEHHSEWDAQVAAHDADCLNARSLFACNAGFLTLGYMAETIRLNLSAVHKPSAPAYKGVPPEQIKTLLSETESAADAVKPAADAYTDAGCKDPLAPECIGKAMTFEMAVDALSRKLDAWSVY